MALSIVEAVVAVCAPLNVPVTLKMRSGWCASERNALSLARAVGEYGSVIFIAGNMPMVSEITPLIIIGKLEQYDTAGATAVAVVMLVMSFALLLLINALQAWQRRRAGAQT